MSSNAIIYISNDIIRSDLVQYFRFMPNSNLTVQISYMS